MIVEPINDRQSGLTNSFSAVCPSLLMSGRQLLRLSMPRMLYARYAHSERTLRWDPSFSGYFKHQLALSSCFVCSQEHCG